MNDIINNCPITKKNSKLLKRWIADSKSVEYTQNGGYHTGVDIEASEVYSICAGVCTYVGKSLEERNVVVIQYDHNTSFRYCNLDKIYIRKGQIINTDEYIGSAHKFVHFEVLNPENSTWCVRVGNRQYYKHDPIKYLTDSNISLRVDNYQYNHISPDIQTEF